MIYFHLKGAQVCIQLYVTRTQFQFQVMIVDFQILPTTSNENIPVEFQLVPSFFFRCQLGISLQVAEISAAGTHVERSTYSCQKTTAVLIKMQHLNAFWTLLFQSG